MKKIPMRSCVITKEKLPKNELVRIVRGVDGRVFVDYTGKANGRGAYLKGTLDVLEKAIKSESLDRHLEVSVPMDIYEEIREYVEKNK